MRPFIQLGLVPLMLTMGLFAWTAGAVANDRAALPASTTYSEKGVAACTKCHDDEHTSALLSGPHGMGGDSRTPVAGKGCESCHGPGAEHAKGSKKFRVAETFESNDPDLAASRSEVCMGCHGKSVQGAQRHFQISEHSAADVACTDCHSLHAREDKITERLSQAEVCAGCHKDQKANMNKYSRHPMREGKVVCTDCHNAHGSKGEHQLVEATTNEVCYKCHAEKRGPFLFEHEPVQDNCAECHNPHGSVNDNLLVARPPFLCQECHNDTRHPGTVYANQNVESVNRAIVRGCTNCHTNVHGSNHPSGVTFRR